MDKQTKYSNLFFFFSFILIFLGLVFKQSFNGSAFYIFNILGSVCFIIYLIINKERLMFWLKRPGVRYGLTSTLSGVIITSVLIIVYVLVKYYPMRYDLTENKRYSLAVQSKEILDKLKTKVNIKVLTNESLADKQTSMLLKSYVNESSKISVQYIPHLENPQVFKQYKVPYENGSGVGTLVIEPLNKQKEYFVIFPKDLYQNSFDPSTRRPSKVYQGESKITSILAKFTDLKQQEGNLIYYTSGHGEADFNDEGPKGFSQLKHAMSLENYSFKRINLTMHKSVPEDSKLLIIASPITAFQKLDIDKIIFYVNRGGALLILSDPLIQGRKASINSITKKKKVPTATLR